MLNKDDAQQEQVNNWRGANRKWVVIQVSCTSMIVSSKAVNGQTWSV